MSYELVFLISCIAIIVCSAFALYLQVRSIRMSKQDQKNGIYETYKNINLI